MGSNTMVITEHLDALQNVVDTRFELVKHIKNPCRRYFCFFCRHEIQVLVCDSCGKNNLTNTKGKLRAAYNALSHAKIEAHWIHNIKY